MHREKEPEPQWGDIDRQKLAQRSVTALAAIVAFTVCWRRYGGGRDVEGRFWALIGLFFWAFFTHDLFCLHYAYAWVAGMVIYRLTMDRTAHSHFEGWPFLMLLFPNYWLAVFAETAALLAIGYTLLHITPFLGMMLLASGLACTANEIMGFWQRRKEVIAYTDGQRELEARRAAYKRGW